MKLIAAATALLAGTVESLPKEVINADIKTSIGVIHVIDSVLHPE